MQISCNIYTMKEGDPLELDFPFRPNIGDVITCIVVHHIECLKSTEEVDYEWWHKEIDLAPDLIVDEFRFTGNENCPGHITSIIK